jgi:hypothetical protein
MTHTCDNTLLQRREFKLKFHNLEGKTADVLTTYIMNCDVPVQSQDCGARRDGEQPLNMFLQQRI